MADERLNARIEVTGSSEEDLRGIAAGFREVATSAAQAAPAVENLAGSFDEAEDEGSSLTRALTAVSHSADDTTSSMAEISGASEGAEEGLEDVKQEASGLNRQLFMLPASSAAAAAGLQALDSLDLDLGDTDTPRGGSTITHEVDVEGDREARRRIRATHRMALGVDGTTIDIGFDTDRVSENNLGSGIDEAEDDVDDLNRSMASGTATALAYKSAISSIGTPGINTGDLDEQETKIGDVERAAAEAADEITTFPGQIEYDAARAVRDMEDDDFIEQQARDHVIEYEAKSKGFNRVRGELMQTLRQAQIVDGTDITLDYDPSHIEGEKVALDYEVERDRDFRFFSSDSSLRQKGREAMQRVQEGVAQGRSGFDMGETFDDSFLGKLNEATSPENVFSDEEFEDFDVESETNKVRNLGRQIQNLPTHSFNIEDEEDLDAFSRELLGVHNTGTRISKTFGDLDDDVSDSLLRQSNSARELRLNLARTEDDTQGLERALNGLGNTTRAMVDEMLAGAESTDEFDDQVGELGSRAKKTSASISGLSDVTKGYTASTAMAAERTDEFGDELQETGNKAIASRLKIMATNNAVGSLQEMVGDTTTQFGPFRMQLSSIAQMLPGLVSLFASLGGVLTAGLAGGAGLAGIFAGGVLQQADQLVDSMEAAGTATEEMQEAEGLERTMLGVEELMSRIGEAAYEAMAPLRQPEFANFAMWGIDQALNLLNEFAKMAAWGADELMGVAEVLAGAWWDNYPTFIGELVNLMEIMGPLLTQIAIGAIEFLPEVFAMMAAEGETVVPLLMDFTSALLDTLPALLAVGTMMLQGILPNLTGMLKGVAALTPAIVFFARVLTDLLAIFDPIVEAIFAVGSAAMVLNSIVPFLTVSIVALRAAFKFLVYRPVLSFLQSIGWLVGWFTTIVKAATLTWGTFVGVVTGGVILAAVAAIIYGILSYFDLWDDAIGVLIWGWNTLVKVMQGFGEAAAGVMEWFVNGLQGMVNAAIKLLNKLPFFEMDKVEWDYSVEVTYKDRLITNPEETADRWASKVPGQESGKNEGNALTDSMSRSPDEYAGPQRLAGGDTYNEYNTYMEGMGTGEMSQEKRIEDAVRRGVKRSQRRERLQGSDMGQ